MATSKLNVRKTKEIILGHPLNQHPIIIHNQMLGIVDSFKYLGVTLGNRLSFDRHTHDIHKRMH